MLATPMRERETMTITFPEIDSEDWELMIRLLQPRIPSPQYPQDYLRVLPWYDKYDFEDGMKMCDECLSNPGFKVKVTANNIGTYASLVGAAYRHNLPKTKLFVKGFIHELLRNRLTRLALTEDDIDSLVPALHQEEGLWSTIAPLLGRASDSHDRDAIISNPLFPDLLLRGIREVDHEYNLEKTMLRVEIQEACIVGVNGVYVRSDESAVFTKWDGNTRYSLHKVNNGDGDTRWLIERGESRRQVEILYSCKVHWTSKVPPRVGWRQNEPGGDEDYWTDAPILEFKRCPPGVFVF
jgi:hypothetical protein